jgi:hypothetical protein
MVHLTLAALVLGAGGIAQAQDRPVPLVSLQALTVPQEQLPSNCALKVIEPQRQAVEVTSVAGRRTIRITPATPSLQPAGVTANPWAGTDRAILAWLRQRVDGYEVRLPDAPPMTRREQSEMLLRSADGVEEGYAATYASSGADIGVHAVRFAVPTAEPFTPATNSQKAVRINIGLIRVALSGNDGACSRAIETYLTSLAASVAM